MSVGTSLSANGSLSAPTMPATSAAAGMKALSVMVVDDELLARSRMKTLLSDCREIACALVAEAGDAMEAMAKLQAQTVDVVLLDIHMPGADGLQLARELRRLRPELAIIFVTAHTEHAVDAFDLEVVDYLTKPVRADRLLKALHKALQKREQHVQTSSQQAPDFDGKFVIIQDRGRTERVPLSEVLYFKAELKYVTVRTLHRSYILDGSLTELEARYANTFMRVHRNSLVARHEIRALERFHSLPDEEESEGQEGWAVRLRSCEDVLQVSRRQLPSVREMVGKA